MFIKTLNPEVVQKKGTMEMHSVTESVEYLEWLADGNFPEPYKPSVPRSVTRRQGQRALLEDGNKLAIVEAMIEAIEDPIEKRRAQIEYEAGTWERGNEFLRSMWAALGGTESELDDLFIMADGL